MRREDGIYLSKRTVMLTIFVSLFINVFFLLMGILIGKDEPDVIRQAIENHGASQPLPVPELSAKNSLDSDLALFEDHGEETREEPMKVATMAASEAVTTPGTTTRPQRQPEPEVKKPLVQTPSRVEQPARIQPEKQGQAAPPKTASSAQAVGYWVQVLATKDSKSANSFRQKVKKLGYQTALLSEGGYYKIQVGPYSVRSQAEAAKNDINRNLKAKGWIRKK